MRKVNRITSHFSSAVYRSVSFYTIVFCTVVLIWVNFNIRIWGENDVIKSDVISYYAYLPAFFIEQSPDLSFTDGKEEEYVRTNRYWPGIAPNGKKVIKTTMGMAVMYFPFFALAHAEAKISGYPADGFSKPYHRWIHLSGLFYFIVGLVFMRKILLRFFSETNVAIAILIITFTTHAFHYATAGAAMSHAASFALIAIFIFLSLNWVDNRKAGNSVFLGCILGMIVLIRPVNLLVVLVPVLSGVTTVKEFSERIRSFFVQWKFTLLVSVFFFVIIFPQLLYWKFITGHWVFNSYIGERFYFSDPHILEGLFSYRKGWLVYTPVMIFSLAGFYFLYRQHRKLFFMTMVFFGINTYVMLSWWCWWYGGGFGMRPMIDSYAIMAIPLACFIHFVMAKKIMLKIAGLLIVLALSTQNLVQSFQLRKGILHWDSMTKEAYWESFMQLHNNEKIKNALHAPDYEKAKRGENEYEF